MKKILWIASLIVLILFMIYMHLYVRPFEFSDLFRIINFISMPLAILIIAMLIAAPTALIPAKGRSYRSRLSFYFPSYIIVISLLLTFAFYITGPHYYVIKSNPAMDCSSVKDGSFKTKNMLIERKGNYQKQTIISTKEEKEYSVQWINSCEYELSGAEGTLKVKIVSVDSAGYDCYSSARGWTSQKQRIDKQ